MDRGALMVATIVASLLGTLAVGLRANLPVALAPGMGVNSIFATLIVGRLGFSWQTGLAVLFVTGLLFLALSLTRMRAGIVADFPPPIKVGIQGAIGVFIAYVGLTASGIVVGRPTTLVALGNLADPGTALAGVLAMPVLFAARARRHPTGHRRRHAGLPPRPRCGGGRRSRAARGVAARRDRPAAR